jgi:hypothetical protein
MAQQTCPTCGGRGAVANSQSGTPQVCPTCDGTTTVSLGTDDMLFHYPINPPQLTASQQGVIASVTIDNDSDFLVDRFVASATGLYSVELTDRFTARPLQTGPINGENAAGTAQLPMWLPKPYLIRRTSSIQGKFNDRSAALNTIQFDLVGLKLA